MLKNRTISVLFILEFIFFGLTVLSVMARTNLSSFFFYCGFGVLFVIIINNYGHLVDKTTGILVLIIVISFLSVLFSGIRNQISLNYKGLVNFFAFSATMVYIDITRNIILDRETIKKIMMISVIIAALYPLGCIIFGFRVSTNLFTMNFSNPNLTGMFLLQSVFYCTVGLFLFKKVLAKIFCVFLMLIDYWLMVNTDARNCIIAHILFLIVVLLCVIRKKRMLKKWMLFFFVSFPLVFMGGYLIFIEKINTFSWLKFLVKDGKNMDSRMGIWLYILNKLKGHYFFGDYYIIGGNAHNSHLSIWSSFGGIVLVLSMIFIYRCMKDINSNIAKLENEICLAAFCGTLFMGIAEGALFCGSLGLYIPSCSFLLLANADWGDNAMEGKENSVA